MMKTNDIFNGIFTGLLLTTKTNQLPLISAFSFMSSKQFVCDLISRNFIILKHF